MRTIKTKPKRNDNAFPANKARPLNLTLIFLITFSPLSSDQEYNKIYKNRILKIDIPRQEMSVAYVPSRITIPEIILPDMSFMKIIEGIAKKDNALIY